jgi:O-succinylbenzoic acid--CoA ligase
MSLVYTFHHTNSRQKKIFLDFLEEWNNTNDFISVNTSGSTGRPKTIEIAKKNMVISALKTLSYFKLKPGQNANLCLSIDTIAGKMMIVRSILGKLHLHIYEPNQLEKMETCDFVALVPMQLSDLVENHLSIIQNTANILVGGAPLNQSLEKKIKEIKLPVFQSFGMTETISHFAIRRISSNGPNPFETLDNITIDKDDENHLIVNYPEIGLNQIKTNDLIIWHSPTRFEWIGRSDFTINSGGIKIQLEQIEKLLEEVLQNPFFLYGIDDEQLGQKLILVIEGQKNPLLTIENIKKSFLNTKIQKRFIFYLNLCAQKARK